MLYDVVRPLLFQFDSERAHNAAIAAMEFVSDHPRMLRLLRRRYVHPDPRLAVTVGGVKMPNPIGLAGGFDKNGRATAALASSGFGSVEVGTVTPLAQPGNTGTRIWRFPAEKALVNAMGFPNDGVTAVTDRLRWRKHLMTVPIGVNVGLNKETPPDKAVEGYVTSVRAALDVADYFTVNVSSPNTQGLRALQQADAFCPIAQAVVSAAGNVPVFAKLAPDLDEEAIRAFVRVCIDEGIRAVIATNTTTSRVHLRAADDLAGGASGEPLHRRAVDVARICVHEAHGRLDVIGVGGILSFVDVVDFLQAGCASVQLYTGYIYEGPSLPRRLNDRLSHLLDTQEVHSVSQLFRH